MWKKKGKVKEIDGVSFSRVQLGSKGEQAGMIYTPLSKVGQDLCDVGETKRSEGHILSEIGVAIIVLIFWKNCQEQVGTLDKSQSCKAPISNL